MSSPHPSAPPTIPVLGPGHNYASITDKISDIVLQFRAPIRWFLGFIVGFSLLQGLLLAIYMLLFKGVGVWGINIPVGWGFDIINFVWWIGIGHAGTLISAILLLFRQQWRTSINRAAEAMTLFAVACALLFPIFHTGRPWLAAYWLLPYPNTMGVWPQFRSPLIWDVFAVSTYGTVSALFWFTGLIPDLATMRDRAKSKAGQFIYGALAMGWRGSARHWQIYETAYLILAGLSTPLVLSVHTVVSFDFAVACAAMFPLLHTGRPWLAAYWLFPYPNTMGLWPQFRSPLIWDVFAVSTYGTVSALFWFTGLVPDMAT
ncbi:MAG TPA: NrfD/PsrC family molybdoenzyme membrane anchor subunit, partial [Vicinamibacterales bacterium]|nr:NrfD/PsrC family molybdoenzyme membrane anchor subunit [Vicinamibacterales bacterium]